MIEPAKIVETDKNKAREAEFVFALSNHNLSEELAEQVFKVLEIGLKISHREIGSLKGLSFNYLTYLESQKKYKASLEKILSNNICLGEFYGDISPKKFLINNIKTLKENGFNVLFMEHLYSHDHQKLLDKDFHSQELSNYLDELDQKNVSSGLTRFKLQEEQAKIFNFKQLVIKARETGIRVVCLDNKFIHQHPDLRDGNNRALVFNAFAKYIINKTGKFYKNKSLPFKWIALVDNSHVNEFKIEGEIEPVPGIADITQCQDLLIFDSKIKAIKNEEGLINEVETEESSIEFAEKKRLLESKLSERKGLKASIFVINKLDEYFSLDQLRIVKNIAK